VTLGNWVRPISIVPAPSALRIAFFGRSIGVTVRLIEFTTAGELDATFAALARKPPEAMVVMSDAALYDLRERISALALKHRFPTIAYVPEFTDAGALMSYGPPRRAMYHRTAEYVKKILAGAKPA